MKNRKLLSTFRYLTLIALVALGLGAILFVLKGNILAVGILVAVAILLSLAWRGVSTYCPKCRHIWYMKVVSRESLFDEAVQVTESINVWHPWDKAYQPGHVAAKATRKAYKETLKCRKCGHTESRVHTVHLKH